MRRILDFRLEDGQAALWFLGQAGYIARSSGVILAIDPYLTDSIGKTNPEFSRLAPPPIEPEDMQVDIFLVTHDHADHLDPETIKRYPRVKETTFVAPRFAYRKLRELGLPEERLVRLDAGEKVSLPGVNVSAVFALPTSKDALDTVGYLLTFTNGRSLYHASDTAYCDLLLEAAPSADVLLVPINGKWGNLNVEQALALTRKVNPRFVQPNHYDLMALNAENPETFRYLCQTGGISAKCVIPQLMEPFVWK